MSGNQNINSPVGNKSMLCSSRLCVSVILSGPSCHHAVCPQAFHRYVSFDQQSTLYSWPNRRWKKNKTISHSTMPFTVSAVSKQAINSSSTTPNQNGHPGIIREDNDMHTSKHRRTPYGVRKHPGQENCVYAPLLFAFLLPNLAAIVWNSAGPQLLQCKCHWLYIKSNASMQSTSSKSQTKHQICLFSFFGTISVPMLLLLCSAPMSLIWEVDVLLAPTDNTRKMESNTAEKQNNFGVEICNKSWTRFASWTRLLMRQNRWAGS